MCDQSRLMRILARVAHACIEGSIFVYTSPGQSRVAPALFTATRPLQIFETSSCCTQQASQGEHILVQIEIASLSVRLSACCTAGFRTFFVVQNAALLWYVGPKQSVPIACKAIFACSLARGLHVLAGNGQVIFSSCRSFFRDFPWN